MIFNTIMCDIYDDNVNNIIISIKIILFKINANFYIIYKYDEIERSSILLELYMSLFILCVIDLTHILNF